jgi:hypothetical protein
MQVDALAVDLRPRSMMEATDLGVRLVQLRARSVWRTVALPYLVIVALALSTVEIAGWLPALLIFWFKPWLDRSLLFVLSRAVFGEETRFADLWQARRSVWWGSLLHTLTLRRLSPWRSFTQAVHQLEGQGGTARRKRRTQFLRGKKGAATAMHLAFAHLEFVFVIAVLALAIWFDPQGNTGRNIFDLLRADDSVATSLLSATVYAGIVLLLEPFYVAAGFAMYLNRRVELEAWDIEQEFRRAFAV